MPATHDPRPIGVFDSGIGGLTAVRELFRQLPHESVVYFGDTARLPYGNKSKETVTRFASRSPRSSCARTSSASWWRATRRRATRSTRCARASTCRSSA